MNMTDLHRPVAGILSAIFLAGALSGCGESDFDVNRKPPLVDRAVAASMVKCDLQENRPQQIPYEARLRMALNTASSAALDKLHENEVTICLDQRLPEMKLGFWSRHIQGAYYPEAKVLSLRDNGRNPQTQSWYEGKITRWSGDNINKLSSEVLGTPKDSQMQLSAIYSYYCGKGCTRNDLEWHAATIYSGHMEKNPHIREAPIRSEPAPLHATGPVLRTALN